MKKTQVGIMIVPTMLEFLDEIDNIVDFYQLPSDAYYDISSIHSRDSLEFLSSRKPLHIHSVDLSIASPNIINLLELSVIKEIQRNFKPVTYSDHMGFNKQDTLWTGLPIINPEFSTETVDVVASNILFLKKNIPNLNFLFENNSRCITWPDNNLDEADFYNKVCEKSSSKMLLDITNLYADSKNFDFNPINFIKKIKKENICMIHIAGGDWLDGFKTGQITRGHHKKVEEEVWGLLREALAYSSPSYVTFERSRNVHKSEILTDLNKIKEYVDSHAV